MSQDDRVIRVTPSTKLKYKKKTKVSESSSATFETLSSYSSASSSNEEDSSASKSSNPEDIVADLIDNLDSSNNKNKIKTNNAKKAKKAKKVKKAKDIEKAKLKAKKKKQTRKVKKAKKIKKEIDKIVKETAVTAKRELTTRKPVRPVKVKEMEDDMAHIIGCGIGPRRRAPADDILAYAPSSKLAGSYDIFNTPEALRNEPVVSLRWHNMVFENMEKERNYDKLIIYFLALTLWFLVSIYLMKQGTVGKAMAATGAALIMMGITQYIGDETKNKKESKGTKPKIGTNNNSRNALSQFMDMLNIEYK